MFLRSLESRVNSLVGLSGSFFAARREVCRQWAADCQSDFRTLLKSVQMGLRGVSDPQSAGYYYSINDERREFDRKVRTVARGMAVLPANLGMLNVFRYGLFSWQLASHKLARWLVPFALIGAALSSLWLAADSPIYAAAALAQSGLYAAAIAGRATGSRFLRIPAFFVVSNVALLFAWLRFVRGDRMATWAPSERRSTLPQTSST
jgi:hypothetical protein